MQDMKEQIKAWANDAYPKAVTWRQNFHRYPEISRHEFKTADTISEALESFGLEPKRVDETGVVCDVQGDHDGPLMFLRADTDALAIQEASGLPFASENEGVMHACGHDLHIAALLAVASILSTKEARAKLHGTVRLCFQHAEEIGHGGQQFYEAGVMEGGDRAFGIHVSSLVPLGQVAVRPGGVMASVDHFVVKVKGKSAHVGNPQDGIDALEIACEMVTALQTIVSRNMDQEAVVLGIGKINAGTAYNIVAKCGLRTRTLSPRMRKKALEFKQIVQHLALAYGAEVEITLNAYSDPLINDETLCRKLETIVTYYYGEDHLMLDKPPSMAGDDFAIYAREMPGCYVYVGFAEEDKPGTQHPMHSEFLAIGDEALRQMIELHLAFIFDLPED